MRGRRSAPLVSAEFPFDPHVDACDRAGQCDGRDETEQVFVNGHLSSQRLMVASSSGNQVTMVVPINVLPPVKKNRARHPLITDIGIPTSQQFPAYAVRREALSGSGWRISFVTTLKAVSISAFWVVLRP